MSLRDKLQSSIKQGQAAESVALPSMREFVKKMLKDEVTHFKQEVMSELKSILSESIGEEGAVALKGDRGFTPQKGVDFFTPQELEQIKKEIMPLKGTHYRDGRDGKDGRDGRTPSLSEVQRIVMGIVKKTPEKGAGDIARALEKLVGNEKLDYYALKNQPYIPKEARKLGGARGGGDIVNVRDLSTSTNGTLKTFTVPYHAKALFVVSSDFPTVLMESNGFTVASNKLSITLTPPNAPSSGSQLLFVYAT